MADIEQNSKTCQMLQNLENCTKRNVQSRRQCGWKPVKLMECNKCLHQISSNSYQHTTYTVLTTKIDVFFSKTMHRKLWQFFHFTMVFQTHREGSINISFWTISVIFLKVNILASEQSHLMCVSWVQFCNLCLCLFGMGSPDLKKDGLW